MKQLRTLKSFQIFKTEIQKSKTYSDLCPLLYAYPMVPQYLERNNYIFFMFFCMNRKLTWPLLTWPLPTRGSRPWTSPCPSWTSGSGTPSTAGAGTSLLPCHCWPHHYLREGAGRGLLHALHEPRDQVPRPKQLGRCMITIPGTYVNSRGRCIITIPGTYVNSRGRCIITTRLLRQQQRQVHHYYQVTMSTAEAGASLLPGYYVNSRGRCIITTRLLR